MTTDCQDLHPPVSDVVLSSVSSTQYYTCQFVKTGRQGDTKLIGVSHNKTKQTPHWNKISQDISIMFGWQQFLKNADPSSLIQIQIFWQKLTPSDKHIKGIFIDKSRLSSIVSHQIRVVVVVVLVVIVVLVVVVFFVLVVVDVVFCFFCCCWCCFCNWN